MKKHKNVWNYMNCFRPMPTPIVHTLASFECPCIFECTPCLYPFPAPHGCPQCPHPSPKQCPHPISTPMQHPMLALTYTIAQTQSMARSNTHTQYPLLCLLPMPTFNACTQKKLSPSVCTQSQLPVLIPLPTPLFTPNVYIQSSQPCFYPIPNRNFHSRIWLFNNSSPHFKFWIPTNYCPVK